MLLKNLIKISQKEIDLIIIKDLSLDSRKVKRGDLFFALKGSKSNGEKFIKQAIVKGAKAVISQRNIKIKTKVPIIKVNNIKKVLEDSCKKFYKKKPKNIIAVTGTNGKSSVADFFYQILSLNKIPAASIGTLGIKKKNKLVKTNLTSLDIITLHKELEKIKDQNIENVIIEASSHGLRQGRLSGINFKAGIFTNFSQDHLDYHKSMQDYLKAKMILFSKLLKKNKYVITDDNLKEFNKIKKISNQKNLKLITINNNSLSLHKKSKKLIGVFQAKNLSMSILAANLCGLKKNKIYRVLNKIKNVNGRLELIRTLPNKSKIFIDYAHTPEALSTVLKSLEEHYRENINLVFGCGGERDIKKRPLMAKVASSLANTIYITDDNPRNENPKKIRKIIINNLKNKNFFEIGNRAKAIQAAVKNSGPNEIILVAGKGHEAYQDYGKKILKISDKRIIRNLKVKKIKSKRKMFIFENNKKALSNTLNKKINFNFKGVSIDSKKIKKGNLFIALKGKNKDGHDYVSNAFKNGASFCVISKKIKKANNNRLIKCKNTKTFLEKFGKNKRILSKAKIIAITGSAGKTSVKTILGNLLNSYGKTYFSPKSFNNHYGVPISLANLNSDHKFGVFEIGMSKKGEIQKLSKMVKPDLGIITNIGEAHLENFKNIDGIAKAKGEIIENIKKGGTLILNRDDIFYNYLRKLGKNRNLKILSFGKSKYSDVHPISIKKNKNYCKVNIKVMNEKIVLKVRNINLYNILSTLAALKSFELKLKKVLRIYEKLVPTEGRGKIHEVNRFKTNFKLIDESYNANPLSVKNAIINLSNIKNNSSKKYILLGDMLELGNRSEFFHKNLSKVINNTDIDKVFVYGEKIISTYKHMKKKKQGNILQYKSDFDEVFSQIIKKDDYLMIKGSNATGLNTLSKNIIKGHNNAI